MKKLALLLCVLMAVMPMMAMAEGEGVYLRISNPEIYEGDELLLELADVALEIGAGLSDVDASVWAAVKAGKANLTAAGAISEENISVSMTGLPAIYKLALADLGITEESLGAMFESVEVPDFAAYADEFAEQLDEITPKIEEAVETATIKEGVQWYMYDGEHTTTQTAFTIPTEVLRDVVEAGYKMVAGMMEETAAMTASMGMDTNVEGTSAEEMDAALNEMFEANPYIDVEIYVDEAADEYVSAAIYLIDDNGNMLPVYLDLYMPLDGVGAYLYIPVEGEADLEVLFENYDNGYSYFAMAVTDPETEEKLMTIEYSGGYDETGDFFVQEFELAAEDLNITTYDHNDYATEHYFELVANAEGTEVKFELATAPTGNGAEGAVAITSGDACIMADLEYGFTDAVVSPAGEGLEVVDILTMGKDDMEAVGMEVGNALMNFLMQAVEEVPGLEMLFGE
ncbi:MAG: hypothetical protein E7335_06625 [Clostridiales bacterium]|nr:hypothetical protein [Clostridiales bacterium]